MSELKYINEIPGVLVTIIVPAYNVERYIEKCLSSILKQTYKNIEVIVVNDGSTDETGGVIEGYVALDNRFKVIHTPNSGVSSARNTGIKASTGEYIIFIDGDDYISSDCVSYMLSLISNTKSDFCLSKYCYLKKGDKQNANSNVENVTSEQAIALLLSPDVVVGCWNKIYKRSLIVSSNILFSTDLFYGEGLTFILKIAQVSKTVGVGNQKVYHYRKNNEDSATTKFDIQKIHNGEQALLEIEKFLGKKSKVVNTMFRYHLSLYRLAALVQLKVNKAEDVYKEDYKSWLSYIRSNVLGLLFVSDLTLYRKLLLLGGSISPSFVAKLDKIRRRQIIKNSVDG